MNVSEVYLELYGRISPLIRATVDGLDTATLTLAPKPGTNPVGWLVWHLTRVQDHHVSEVLDQPQLWVSDDWSARFGLTLIPGTWVSGHQTPDIATVKPESAQALIDYYDAVYARTRPILEGLTPRPSARWSMTGGIRRSPG